MPTRPAPKPRTLRRTSQREGVRVEAAVLAPGPIAIVQLVGEAAPISLRAHGAAGLVSGQTITLVVEKRWPMPNGDHAQGRIEFARIDVSRLGLTPLPLEGPYVDDLRQTHENYEDPNDPYTALWVRATAKPRECWELDGIAWGAFPGTPADESVTEQASALREAGDIEGARELLHETLVHDLRYLDAHAHLGNWLFERSPERAIVHYEIGTRIGELSAPEEFTGILPWGLLFNRPFLRCLHGYGLCLWRMGRIHEAKRVFERLLALNPVDNQGARFCWTDVCEGRSWEETNERERREEQEIRRQMAAAARQARSRRRNAT